MQVQEDCYSVLSIIFMNRLRIFVLLLASFVLSAIPLQGGVFRSGIDVLDASGCRELKGKKVALITNAAGVTARGESNYAMLLRHGISLAFLMAPEHGFAVNVEAGKKNRGSRNRRYASSPFSLWCIKKTVCRTSENRRSGCIRSSGRRCALLHLYINDEAGNGGVHGSRSALYGA